MEAIQIADTLAYPWRSDQTLKRLLIGATITFLGIFLLPLFISLGYYTQSLSDTLAGRSKPPVLDTAELLPLFATGFGAMGIICVFAVLVVLVATVITAIIGVATTGGFIAESIASHMTVFALLLGVLGAATAYILPASLARYGQSGSLLAGLRPDTISTIALNTDYAVGIGFSILLLSVVIGAIAASGAIPPIAIVLALTAKFPTVLLMSRAHGNAIAV